MSCERFKRSMMATSTLTLYFFTHVTAPWVRTFVNHFSIGWGRPYFGLWRVSMPTFIATIGRLSYGAGRLN